MSNDPMTNWDLDIGIYLEIRSIRLIRDLYDMARSQRQE